MFSPSRVRMVLIPSRFSSCAARNASSIVSPGMKRETDFRTNAALVARSRSHAFVDPASSTFRITDITTLSLLGLLPLEDAPDLSAVHLHGRTGHVRGRIGQQERSHAAELIDVA